MTFTDETLDKSQEEILKSMKSNADISIDIDHFSNVDPLMILDLANDPKPASREILAVGEYMLNGSTITVKQKDKVIKSVLYNRGGGTENSNRNSLSMVFSDMPYALQKIINIIYVEAVKKSLPSVTD